MNELVKDKTPVTLLSLAFAQYPAQERRARHRAAEALVWRDLLPNFLVTLKGPRRHDH